MKELISDSHIGVLLVNIGSPDAPTFFGVRRYLAQFLSDRRVIEQPRWSWLPILHGIILNVRPTRSARHYLRIWTKNGSPLVQTTLQIADGLSASLSADLGRNVPVIAGMRYGNPSLGEALRSLQATGPKRLIVLPLFPQYSSTTNGTILEAVFNELRSWRWIPHVQVIANYHDHPAYINALRSSIADRWEKSTVPQQLLFSFHGIPISYAERGDPYPDQCRTTARLAADALGLGGDEWMTTFQSRFGPQPWLQPYTDESLVKLGEAGLSRLSVICPGFAADCLETLDEIGREGRLSYEMAGGSGFDYIPALNASQDHLQALSEIVLEAIPNG
jgi:ferrochelatase